MGVCLSCLRGREKESHHAPSENQPLLGDEHADYGAGDLNDEQWIQRQQDLDNVVQRASNHFIDVSVVKGTEAVDMVVGGLPEDLEARLQEVRLEIPPVEPISENDRRQFLEDIKQINGKQFD